MSAAQHVLTLVPLVGAFQAAHPNVHVQILVTERMVDQIEGVGLVFRVGALKDSTLVARKIFEIPPLATGKPGLP